MKTLAANYGPAWLSRSSSPGQAGNHHSIGLCLSSGGARGLAHIGVIQVLEEAGVPITAIAGSSMGAYVGSLWASGFTGQELEQLAREIKDRRTLYRLLDPVFPPSRGLIRGQAIRAHLERSLGGKTFADLKKPLLVVATDLETMTPKVFGEEMHGTHSVPLAVTASAAIPGICLPIEIDDRVYIDGGASDPLPVTTLRRFSEVDRVIAVNVLPTPRDLKVGKPVSRRSRNPLRWLNLLASGNVLDTFSRALRAAQVQLIARDSDLADVLVHPFLPEGSWHDFHNFTRYIKAGRDAATALLPQILALTGRVTEPEGGHDHETPESHTQMGFLAA